jgi:hypothetical protein
VGAHDSAGLAGDIDRGPDVGHPDLLGGDRRGGLQSAQLRGGDIDDLPGGHETPGQRLSMGLAQHGFRHRQGAGSCSAAGVSIGLPWQMLV